MFQHTAARRRLDTKWLKLLEYIEFQHTAARRRLAIPRTLRVEYTSFNTQPPEGGWELVVVRTVTTIVSTHSRPKAAG